MPRSTTSVGNARKNEMAGETNGYISRGNMSIILVAAGLILGGFGWFTTNQNAAIDRRISELRDEVQANRKAALGKSEHEEFKYRLDRDIALLRDEQQRRGSSIVPRTEHEARWSAYEANQKLMSERLNEVRNLASANSTVPLRDEINRVQIEISDLRKLLVDRVYTKP